MTDQITYTIGIPYPMGASTQGRNLNIAVVMHPKKECGILLYKSVETGEEEIRIPFTEEYAVGDVYCISFSGLDSRKYTYLFYEDDRIFVDPYATRVVGNEKWHPYAEGYSKEKEIHLRSGVAEDSFDWKNDHKPKTPFSDSILYCLHVRGFTIDPSSKVRGKGTFTGIIEKIPYLLELGIIDEEIAEPLGGAHTDYSQVADNIKHSVLKALGELLNLTADELRAQRYDKFRVMGRFIE